MKELTKAEEEIMQKLWLLEKAFVKDIIAELPLPKPAYNTVSTIVRILETKGFVGHETFGKSHRYFPLVERDTYRGFMAEKLVSSYFSNSASSLLSFFLNRESLDMKEVDKILEIVERAKKNRH